MLEKLFGTTVTLSTGRVIPTRWVGEQHVREDLAAYPPLRIVLGNPAGTMDGPSDHTWP
jgi:hypothetical protein